MSKILSPEWEAMKPLSRSASRRVLCGPGQRLTRVLRHDCRSKLLVAALRAMPASQ